MQIHFDHIIPDPISEKLGSSDIWDKNLIFHAGKHYVVFAPSGKGKSTFAHIVYGLRKDFKGNVSWGDQHVIALNWTQLQKIRSTDFAIIFQDLRLFDDLSAKENIAIHQNEENQLNWDQITNWAKRLEMDQLLDQKAGLLSYGQKQRIAILRALSRPFKWLIMDEPFSHLDQKNKSSAAELIKEVANNYQAGTITTALDEFPDLFSDQSILVL